MKNYSLPIQIVLIVAVAVLYFLHFKQTKHEGISIANLPPAVVNGSSKMVYVNIDTLLEHYDYYQKIKSDFEQKQKRVSEDVDKKKTILEKEYSDAQNRAKSGMMTESEMQETEALLMKKQQDLIDYKGQEEEKLAMENQQFTKTLYGNISGFLKKLNQTTNYQFVFGYTHEGGILLANDSLNITSFVVESLNKEFKENAKK